VMTYKSSATVADS